MEIPFSYGKIVSKNEFVNRTEDIKRLENNFLSLNNTILISPRRWGKSSLVEKVSKKLVSKHKDYRVCTLDLFKIRTEQEFYKAYVEAVINATNNKLDETLKSIKSFFKLFIPKISINPDPQSEISLSMDWQEIAKNPDEILSLSEKIAKKKKIKIIICLDEFQNIASFKDPVAFQKKLRASWQHHKNTAYCIYGSKRHMMMELFSNHSLPFYKFGDLMFIDKISTKHWVKYIQNQFKKSSKSISNEDAGFLVEQVNNHSYYVQQLAQLAWLRTKDECTRDILDESITTLQLQLSMVFQQITDTLSNKQVNFLRALIDNVDELTSKETILKYKLSTASTVIRAKNSLEHKDILDLFGKKISFNDPVYRLWLKNYYFN